ncbi:Cytochrome P450 4B1 [Varanus komodoensis]|nr:Cytochrome P450 4B1 [Varanus komodoensis]
MENLPNAMWFWLPGHFSQHLHLALALILISVALKAFQLFQTRRKLLKGFRNFPGPPYHWLYGHIQMLKPGEELRNIRKWTDEFPQCFPVWYGRWPVLCINHPEYAKAVYSRNGSHPKCLIAYNLLVPWIGRGLLILNGPKWQQHRKLLTPGFHYEILKSYVTPIAESVKVMLDNLEKLVQEDSEVSVEMFEHVSLMTLDIIMKCAFSFQSNCQVNRDSSYVKTISDLTFLVNERTKVPLHYIDLIYWFSSPGRQFRKACRLAHLQTGKIIQERQEALRNEQELEKYKKKRHLDFLDILLCAKDKKGNPLSQEDLRAEVDTFMFAGHDTTASGISWLFYCMAQNPEHQQRCREEIMELTGDQGTIQWDDLGKMAYTTMCIKESLRLYPPASVVVRVLGSHLTFHDGRTLPEGSFIGLNVFGLHRNPEVWDNPEVFDPTRFSPENASLRHPYAYLPFSAGPRNCIGQQFAMTEMKVALALTLLRFELKPDPEKPSIPVVQIVTQSKSGVHLKLKKLI